MEKIPLCTFIEYEYERREIDTIYINVVSTIVKDIWFVTMINIRLASESSESNDLRRQRKDRRKKNTRKSCKTKGNIRFDCGAVTTTTMTSATTTTTIMLVSGDCSCGWYTMAYFTYSSAIETHSIWCVFGAKITRVAFKATTHLSYSDTEYIKERQSLKNDNAQMKPYISFCHSSLDSEQWAFCVLLSFRWAPRHFSSIASIVACY